MFCRKIWQSPLITLSSKMKVVPSSPTHCTALQSMFPKTQIFSPITTEQWLEIGKLHSTTVCEQTFSLTSVTLKCLWSKRKNCFWYRIQSKITCCVWSSCLFPVFVCKGPRLPLCSWSAKLYRLSAKGQEWLPPFGLPEHERIGQKPVLHWRAAGWAKALGEYWRTNNNDTYDVVFTICRALFEMLSMF